MPEQKPYLSGEEWVKEILAGERDFSRTCIEDAYDVAPHINELRKSLRASRLRVEPIYLEDAELKGLIAPGLQLPYVHAPRSQWQFSELPYSNFREGIFHEANLERVDFRAALLRGADFWRARLYYVHLGRKAHYQSGGPLISRDGVAELHRARLTEADCRHAILRGAQMLGAKVDHARFDYADLVEVHLDSEENGTTGSELEDIYHRFIQEVRSARFHRTRISESLSWLRLHFDDQNCFEVEASPQ